MVPVIVAGVVAFLAFSANLLTVSGAMAAAVIGAAAMVAGSRWVVMLLFFFVGSNVIARWRHRDRETLVGAVVEKGGRRDAWQVLANGGVFAFAALLASRAESITWEAIGIGALATAAADTWSTEIGTVLGGTPRSMFTGREVAPGTSGGITIAGSIAALAAAILAAVVAGSVDWSTPALAIVTGGVAGSVIDSALGATVQERRWCPSCDASTERHVHSCGTTTVQRGGIRGFDNDLVNLSSTIAGAVITWILSGSSGTG
jgi:uncharacterized protein (TIGR00297 family)